MPLIGNVPFVANRNFTGREELLDKLHAALAGESAPAGTQAVVHGPGGVGKTQLAIEYCYRHKSDYRIVWWLRAGERITLAGDFAALAAELRLMDGPVADQEALVASVKQELSQRSDWLLVFDNADSPAIIRDFTSLGAGAALVTSRNPSWPGLGEPLEVDVWPSDQGLEFLRKRTGRQEEDSDAVRLVERLGRLPQALEQAGAYIDASGITIADYLTLFDERSQGLLGHGTPDDHRKTVATACALAMERVRQDLPSADDLLALCACLGSDVIPLELFTGGAKCAVLSTLAGEQALADAIAKLWSYSLVKADSNSLFVPRLVRQITIESLDDDRRRSFASAAVSLLAEAFPNRPNNSTTWPACARLLPHVLAVVEHQNLETEAVSDLSSLVNRAGYYLWKRSEFLEAKNIFERALKINRKTHGDDHASVAVHHNNLGNALRSLGDLKGAGENYERALGIDRNIYGDDHPTVAIRHNNLGDVLRGSGKLHGAKESYERALQIDRKAFSDHHPNVAVRHSNLGNILRDLGDFYGARENYERALEIDRKIFGDQHPNVAVRLNNLDSVLRDLGDLRGARETYKQESESNRDYFGSQQPSVLASPDKSIGLIDTPQLTINIVGSSEFSVGKRSELKLNLSNDSESSISDLNVELDETPHYRLFGDGKAQAVALGVWESTEVNWQMEVLTEGAATLELKINGQIHQPALSIYGEGNPYFYGSAITDSIHYVGREGELKDLISFLSRVGATNAFIVGEQGSGKSSLLVQLRAGLTKPILPVYLSLTDIERGSVDDGTKWILEELAKEIAGHYKIDVSASTLTDAEDFRAGMHSLMGIIGAHGFNKIVILLDEAQILADFDILLQERLRIALSKMADQFHMVFASNLHFLQNLENTGSPLPNVCEYIFLKPLTEDALEELVRGSAKRSEYVLEDQAFDEVRRIAGGHPHFTQFLCAKSFDDARNSNSRTISAQNVLSASEIVIEKDLRRFERGCWDFLSESERQCVARIWRGQALSSVSPQIISKLEKKCLIKSTAKPGYYKFSAQLFEAWTKQLLS